MMMRERKVTVAFARDKGAGEEEYGAGSATLAVPVAHQLLHGAGVLPERHAGPFLQAPSERTLRKERPPAWSAPSSPARTPVAADQNPRARPHYSPQSPWPLDCDARKASVLRPASAGQKQPEWYFVVCLPACTTHPLTYAPTHPRLCTRTALSPRA